MHKCKSADYVRNMVEAWLNEIYPGSAILGIGRIKDIVIVRLPNGSVIETDLFGLLESYDNQ